jgi:parallel beta-helix repeat protein
MPDVNNAYSLGSSLLRYADIYGVNIDGANVTATNLYATNVTSNVIPSSDVTLDLGSAIKRWRALYTSAINATDLTLSGSVKSSLIPNVNHAYNIGSNLLRYDTVFTTDVDATTTTTYNLTASFVLSNLIPVFDIYQELGSAVKRWKTLYASAVIATDLTLLGSIKSNLIPDVNHAYNIGSNLLRYSNVFTTDLDATTTTTYNLTTSFVLSNLIPVFDIYQELGSAVKRWKTLYTSAINATDLTLTGSINATDITLTGSITAANLTLTGSIKSSLIPNVNHAYNIGSNLLRYDTVFTTDVDAITTTTTNLTTTNVLSNLTPTFDAYQDLGTAAKRWRTLYSAIVNTTAYVNTTMTTAQIQAIISNTSYNVIEFQSGTYILTTYLNVNRSNVILNGNQAYLKLDNNANSPNIFVGDMTTNPPTIVYENIQICNFNLDGNKANQTSETCTAKYWIYNNTVGINLCHNVIVKGCELNNAKSGGFTATYNCKYITVQSCYSTANTFDGLTAYGSENVSFINNHIVYNTAGAGISVDINVLYLSIIGNIVTNNNLGIFARYINDCVVTGNVISANSTHGFFLSGYNQTPNDQGCSRWSITGNSISNNGGHGLFMQGCNDFVISGNNFYHNAIGINITSYSGLPFATYGVSSRNNITGNTISGNTNLGFYNDASNNYTNGARDNYLTFNIIKNNTVGQIVGDLSSFTLDDDTVINTQSVVLKQSSGYISTITAQTAAANIAFNLPTSNGVNGYILSTDGSGNTFWIDSVTVSSNPIHQVCDASCNIAFPVSYTPSSYISPMIISVTFPTTGSYRAVISYNLLVAGLGGSAGQYSAYVSDGTYKYAPSYGYILNGTTQMVQGNSITSQSSYSNVTKSFTLYFNNTQYCSLLAAASVGYDPYFAIYLVKA